MSYKKTVIDLPASVWSVRFEPRNPLDNGEALRAEQRFSSFSSWSESENPAIRYFAGSAHYQTRIQLTETTRRRYLLRLSELHELCTVRVNGKELGTIWAYPLELDLTSALHAGDNSIELVVTNLWPNRLIGDAQPDTIHPTTKTNIRAWTAKLKLLPSGLIGPVQIDAWSSVELSK